MNQSVNASMFQVVLAFCTLATGTTAMSSETELWPEQVTSSTQVFWKAVSHAASREASSMVRR
jgi:hypothetical protein